MKKIKIPKFKNEDEERDFWGKTSLIDVFDSSDFKPVIFPNLKPSTKSISLRLTESMLDRLKMLANKKDIPYQSFIKMILDERIRKEFNH